VVGLGVTGRAVARALLDRGYLLTAVDDSVAKGAVLQRQAAELGIDLVCGPGEEVLARLAGEADLVVLSPGVPPGHPVLRYAAPGRTIAEIELAWRLSDVPIAAITGTNGKTTVTSLVASMLAASGVTAVAAGNIGPPLIGAVTDPPPGLEVVVVEVSSFQLMWTVGFRPRVACWLNLSEDHLDWHRDLAEYAAAKERIWQNQQPDDLAVANAEDPVVLGAARRAKSRLTTFGLAAGDFHEEDGRLLTPGGAVLLDSAELPRSLPHDRANALAAAAVALGAGATTEGCAAALRAGVPLAHRIELVGAGNGLTYYDDSKATTPAAVCAAVSGFDSVVLIAGGRNKGLDLSIVPSFLRREQDEGGPGPSRLRAVVAIGEAAGEVTAAFAGICPVVQAGSMADAVSAAAALGRDGDAVLLSPGCASFDWYGSYGERGLDFSNNVSEVLRREPASSSASRQEAP
jgi:UDP-N-acetylmuramoylalanine--D-glutamate ligase